MAATSENIYEICAAAWLPSQVINFFSAILLEFRMCVSSVRASRFGDTRRKDKKIGANFTPIFVQITVIFCHSRGCFRCRTHCYFDHNKTAEYHAVVKWLTNNALARGFCGRGVERRFRGAFASCFPKRFMNAAKRHSSCK